jgi:hypothetical protein
MFVRSVEEVGIELRAQISSKIRLRSTVRHCKRVSCLGRYQVSERGGEGDRGERGEAGVEGLAMLANV